MASQAEPLLPRVARGDAIAVRACIDRYSALIWSLAKRLLPGSPDVEDAVQEIFIDLWRNAERFDSNRAAESTFVTMIARRRLIDRRRAWGRRPSPDALPENLACPGCLDRVELQDEAACAIRALQELRDDERDVLMLSIYQGLTHEEIAGQTGLPLGTVKTHIRRGLIRVRERLDAQSQTSNFGGAT